MTTFSITEFCIHDIDIEMNENNLNEEINISYHMQLKQNIQLPLGKTILVHS